MYTICVEVCCVLSSHLLCFDKVSFTKGIRKVLWERGGSVSWSQEELIDWVCHDKDVTVYVCVLGTLFM